MEASTGSPLLPSTANSIDPLSEKIKQKLLQNGVHPTPKIIHTLRKKHRQKSLRKSNKLASQSPIVPLTQSQNDTFAHELYLKNISKEYKEFSRALDSKPSSSEGYIGNLAGRPWDPLERVNFEESSNGFVKKGTNFGVQLKFEHLKELGLVFEQRKIEALSTFLDDDIEVDEGSLKGENGNWSPFRRRVCEADAIRILVDRLTAREITMKDWKFTRMMKQSELQFTEDQLLKIIGGVGDRGCWKQAMEVVEWVYSKKEHKYYKSRFVYTKLLAVLRKGRRPYEALKIFNHMRGDFHIYPDMAAYHTIAVTLGQAGMVRELMSVIECMKEKPSKSIKNRLRKNWDPTLQPDVVILNSVLNACVPTHHWKGVSWVFQQLRKGNLLGNSATYGLAMEVMLQASKYDRVHQLFEKMKTNGKSPNALTYKVLVKTFWKEDKVDEAVQIVRKMEERGITGSASVYYELACCLCSKGRWQEAINEIKNMKKLRHSRPLAVAFTGMILSSMDGGHIDDCTSIFKHMRNYCHPNIGTVNAMLKVYGRNDMFVEAKELFEKVERSETSGRGLGDENTSLVPDEYTYGSMLEISGNAQQWEYFEYVYKEMCFSGYQLDQGKHAALLVEASKAGKWHLLEHAFETTLEAGEIPYPILFAEMLFQAMFQHDYEKAAGIVNTMAHAPFQFNKKDWIALFEKNKSRITDVLLQQLSDSLSNCDMPEEPTALELIKALQFVCGSVAIERSCTRSIATINTSSFDGNDRDTLILESPSITKDKRLLEGNFDHDQVSVRPAGDRSYVLDDVHSGYMNYESDGDDDTSSSDELDNFFEDVTCGEYNHNLFDDQHLPHGSDSKFKERKDPELPSAEEILQSWREIRTQDTIPVD